MRFQKGQSGNPAGKKRGTKHARTSLREYLEPGQEKDLVKKIVDLALAGDSVALRICMDRLLPLNKAKDLPITLPDLTGKLADQGRTVLAAMADGQITPDEANSVMAAISAQVRIVEADELEKRIAALEEKDVRKP